MCHTDHAAVTHQGQWRVGEGGFHDSGLGTRRNLYWSWVSNQ